MTTRPSHPEAISRRRGLLRAMAHVATANAIFTVLTFVASPLAARALGPTGRGRLAAITVPFGWAPTLASLGLPNYATRAAARKEGLGKLIGTLGAASLSLGVVGFLLGIPLAYVLAPHDYLVRDFILIGLALLPLTLLTYLGLGLVTGLEEWTRYGLVRIIPPVTVLIAYVTLFLLGALNVATAAIALYLGSVISILPLLGLLSTGRPLRFDRVLLRRARTFGVRAWIATLAGSANYRLDQLLMIPLVSARQLGLYAVAVNVSGVSSLVLGALSTVLGPSVARGNTPLIGQALRMTLFSVAASGVVAAIAVPWVLPLVFGTSFRAAVPMCLILLAASIPAAGAVVLGGAVQNAGYPDIPARSELGALMLTVPGLVLLLPSLAGIGAAIVSAVAYTVNLLIQLILVRRLMQIPLTELLLVTRADILLLARAARRELRT